MKVLFHYRGNESIAIEYLSAFLKAAGHETALAYDPGADDPLYFQAPFLRPLNRYDRLYAEAEAFGPDLIAMSVLTNLYPAMQAAAREYKRRMPEVPIIVGGTHPTMVPNHAIREPAFDYLCVGEGEHPLLDLVHALEEGRSVREIPNIWSRDGAGRVWRNEVRPIEDDLDKFPLMDKDPWYAAGTFKDIVLVPTGRGCPHRCSFCESHIIQRTYDGKGRVARKRGIPSLLRELRHWRERYRPRFLHFMDPTFNVDLKWMDEFLPAYEKHMERFPFLCQLVVQTNTPEIIRKLGAAGCHWVYMGLDSGNEKFRKETLHRDFDNRDIVAVTRELRRAGVKVQLSSIFGSPGETLSMMNDTLDLIDQIRPDMLSSYIMYPFPETDMSRAAIAEGVISEEAAEDIRNGRRSYHQKTLFNHPHAREAENLARLAPAYNAMPTFLRPWARRIALTGRLQWVLRMLFLVSLPLLYNVTGRVMLMDWLRGIRRASLPAKAPAR
ncbi:MAG: B12-binding domain-containing radical SAM protein, partial [Candidatus Methylomirabilis sp.]|nr:B12-binding domain-containing radical SAM protein [Deltaproteobacteria bacterium]